MLKTHLWTHSILMGFPQRLRCYSGSTWLLKRLEEIYLDDCYCLTFVQLLQLPLGRHCQLVNIHKRCFLTGAFQDITNDKTCRYWAALPRRRSEFIVQCGRNNSYIPKEASQGVLSSSRLLRKQGPFECKYHSLLSGSFP